MKRRTFLQQSALALGACVAGRVQPSRAASAEEKAAQDAAAAAAVTVEIASSRDGSPQKAIFWRPDAALPGASGAPVPLLVHLHSWSGDYRQAAGMISHARRLGWVLVGPDFRGPNRRPEACASELASQDVLDAVDYAERNARVDPDRIYLVGGSGGGHMSLVMAARAPQVWAAVSSWCPITDLAAWHAESSTRRNNYARMLEQSCGGPPGPDTEAEYRLRSPLFHLAAAKDLPVDISTGIHDGHTGSVPVSHTLRAFNALASAQGGTPIADEAIAEMVATRKVPPALAAEREQDPERSREVLFRRTVGNVRVSLFEGGHEFDGPAAIAWLSRQRRGQKPDWSIGRARAPKGSTTEISK